MLRPCRARGMKTKAAAANSKLFKRNAAKRREPERPQFTSFGWRIALFNWGSMADAPELSSTPIRNMLELRTSSKTLNVNELAFCSCRAA
jgi:hypothetical protein